MMQTGNTKVIGKTLVAATLPTEAPTRPAVGSNAVARTEEPATDRLSCGAAFEAV